MRSIPKLFLSLVFVFIVGKGQTVLSIKGEDDIADLLQYYTVYEDPTAALTFQQISQPQYSDKFKHIPSASASLGYSTSAIWIRINVLNADTVPLRRVWVFDYAVIDTIEVFYLDQNMSEIKMINGQLVKPSDRSFLANSPSFRLSFDPGKVQTIYARIVTNASKVITSQFLSENKFSQKVMIRYLMMGLLSGILIAMIVYHVFLFVAVHEIGYLFYVGHVFSYLTYQTFFYGFLSQITSVYSLWLTSHMITFAAMGILTFGYLFVRELLDTKKQFPMFDKCLLFGTICGLLLPIFSFLVPNTIEYKSVSIIAGLFAMSLFSSSIFVIRKKSDPALYFVVGILLLSFGMATRALRNIGYIDVTIWTTHALDLSNVFEIIFFALGFGARIKIRLEEKEREKYQMQSKLAGDLHDDIGSTLSGIAIAAQMKSNEKQLSASDQKEIKEIGQMALNTANTMRDIVWFINPHNESLPQLLIKMKETAGAMLPNHEITFSVSEGKMMVLPPECRRNLYLIFKEVLHNIAKHAQASSVTIAITGDSKKFQLKISDNGTGFDPSKEYSGQGLQSMKKRAELCHGSLVIDTSPEGTSIALNLLDLN